MAGWCPPVAPHLYVDLHGHRTDLRRLSTFQWQLPASSVRTTRHTRRLAHGPLLFLLRPEASRHRGIQLSAETRLYVGHRTRSAFNLDRFCRLEAGAILLAGVVDGRVSPGKGVAFPGDVGADGLRLRAPDHGRSAWLEQFHVHAHRVEEGSGIHLEITWIQSDQSNHEGRCENRQFHWRIQPNNSMKRCLSGAFGTGSMNSSMS